MNGTALSVVEDFRIPAANSLNAALAADLKDVVIIGRARNGKVIVWSNTSGERTNALIDAGTERIEELTYSEEDAA